MNQQRFYTVTVNGQTYRVQAPSAIAAAKQAKQLAGA